MNVRTKRRGNLVRNLNTPVDNQTAEKVRREAVARDESQAQVVRRALRHYFETGGTS